MAHGEVEALGLIRVEEIMPRGREYGVVEEEAEAEVKEEGEALGLEVGALECIRVKLKELLRRASNSGWNRNARLVKDSSDMMVLLTYVGS